MFKLITFVVVLLAVSINAQNKVKVHVFYESLCPDSRNFIQNQLLPNIDAFNNYIDVVLVPFGKSRHNGNGQFTCQHGANECRLNRIMSCALENIPLQLNEVKYVGCQMIRGADLTGQTCVEDHGLNWDTVSNCHDSNTGAILQIECEREQQRIIPNGYPTFVPTIIYNEVYNKALQDQSLYDFRGVLCSLLGPGGPC